MTFAAGSLGFQAPVDSLRPSAPLGTRTLSGEEIRQVGITRLTDLFELAGVGAVFAIDSWQRMSHPPGAAPFQARTWKVWIDDQPISTGLAPRSLNGLPVTVEDLARVEVIDGPAWYRGSFVPYGALHLHTRSPTSGGSMQANYWTGNETGDPGPYRYEDLPIQNVDHDGPDVTLSGGYASSGTQAQTTVLMRSHIPTKPAQRRRIASWTSEFPKRHLWGGALKARTATDRHEHQLRAGASTLRDFVFWEATAREIPLQRTQIHAGINGNHAPMRRHRIVYHTTYDEEKLTGVDGVPFGVEARTRQFEAQGQWLYANTDTRATLTSNVQARAFSALDHTVRRMELGAHAQKEIWGAQPFLSGTVGLEEGASYLNGMVGVRSLVGEALLLSIRTAWIERAFRKQQPLVYVSRHGFSLLDSMAIRLEHSGMPSERTFHAEGRAKWSPQRRLGFSGRLFWRRQRGVAVLRRKSLTFDAGEHAFSGPLGLQSGSGSVAGVQLRGRWRWNQVQQTTSVLAQESVEGNATYRGAWRAAPRWQVSSRWRWGIAPRFSLAAQLRGQSGTRWESYARADELSEGAYQADVPASWVVNLSAQKRFWDEHLRLGLLLRNVFNWPVQTHPLGATTGLMFAFEASLRL